MLWPLIPGLVATVAKAAGLGVSLRLPLRKWLAVKLWLLLALLEDIAIYLVLCLGFSPKDSLLYAQVYYWSDLIVVFAGLLVLMRLAETALANTRVDLPLMRGISIAILAGLVVISFGTVFSRLGTAAFSLRHLINFANEAEQNMAAAGMLASLFLWVAVNILRVQGVRVRRIVTGFGIFYSASACGWSLVQLFGPRASIVAEALFTASLALLAYAMSEREDRDKPASPRRMDVPAALPQRGAA